MATEDVNNILLYNARIYCSGQEDYNWMIFNSDNGYIKQVGRGDAPLVTPPLKNQFNLSGKRLLPGLQESHIHVGFYANFLRNVDLYDCESIEELQDRVSRFIQDHPGSAYVLGVGWEHDKMGRQPTRDDIDMVCSDRPVVLRRACHHVATSNSRAIALLGITKETPDPEGGKIDRYPDNHMRAGEPNGITRECNHLFQRLIAPTKDEVKEAIKTALNNCLSFGVTCVHTLESDHDVWSVYKQLADEDQLSIRVIFVPYYENRHAPDFPVPGETHGKLLSCDRIKLFADGSLGGATAALSLPYKGTEDKGLLIHKQEDLTSAVAKATSEGYRLEIHAIGDAAADSVLIALKTAQVAPEKRPIMVHCQVLREDLIERMRTGGVIASIQPQFVLTDARWLEDLLPDELQSHAYVWKTLLKSGVRCCGGSDAPCAVRSPQPLLGIYDAIFRPSDCRGPQHITTFKPEECLSVTEAIDLYTKGGAYAACRDLDLGQLLPGYQADFIVVDSEKDVCNHPEYFSEASVNQVWLAGQRKL